MLKIDLSRLGDSLIGRWSNSSFFNPDFNNAYIFSFLECGAAGQMVQARLSQKITFAKHAPAMCNLRSSAAPRKG